MNSLPRPAVFGAALSLAGVSLLGLYVGIHDSVARPFDEPSATGDASTVALRPGMAAAIPAQPLKTDSLPPSSAPTQVAQATKAKAPASDEEDDQDQDVPESSAPAARHIPEPPPLYNLDQPQTPPAVQPPSQDNSPPF